MVKLCLFSIHGLFLAEKVAEKVLRLFCSCSGYMYFSLLFRWVTLDTHMPAVALMEVEQCVVLSFPFFLFVLFFCLVCTTATVPCHCSILVLEE